MKNYVEVTNLSKLYFGKLYLVSAAKIIDDLTFPMHHIRKRAGVQDGKIFISWTRSASSITSFVKVEGRRDAKSGK